MGESVGLRTARYYLRLGFRPIPCQPRGKTPLLDWKEFQERSPTEGEIKKWWTETPDANLALVLCNGQFVIDLDGEEAGELLTRANIEFVGAIPTVKTGRGKHLYFRSDTKVRNTARLLGDHNLGSVDVRGTGGYVIAPPSVHASGAKYSWVGEPLANIPPEPPQRLLELVSRSGAGGGGAEAIDSGRGAGWVARALSGVTEGMRDNTATQLAGYFLGRGCRPSEVIELLKPWAAQCDPPFDMKRIPIIVKSVYRREAAQITQVTHISDVLDDIDPSAASSHFVATPFEDVNGYLVGGMGQGELIFVGGRPGMGKTALALEFSTHAASEGHNVLVNSNEMKAVALGRRIISQRSEGTVKASDLKLGTADRGAVGLVKERLRKLPIWFVEKCSYIDELEKMVDSFAQRKKLDLLIVDYLQIIRAKGYHDARQQVEFVSSELKRFAMKYDCAVLVLSSLSRAADGVQPEMKHLRESGNLEHDADAILFVWQPKKDQGRRELIVAKSRDGGVGITNIEFQDCFVRFAQAETLREEELARNCTEGPDAIAAF